jgi:acyl-CoA synthetase (AMP-forming)/AMP-acid ligase II
VLTASAVAWQLAALERALDIDPEVDTGVAWLPMAHDMGLFGCVLLTYWTSHRLVLGTPERFLTRPHTWLDDCAHFGATVSAAPGFALGFAARAAARRSPPPLAIRGLVLGGDRIAATMLDRAATALGGIMPRSALMPAYGLAEVTLAATMTPIGSGPRVAAVDPLALSAGEVAVLDDPRAARIVSAGPPLPGVRVEVGGGGSKIGEIRVDSPSLASGYLGTTAERFSSEGICTGDLGFMLDGELYVTGRSDDLIPVAGRNVYARDIEAGLDELPGVRTGAVAVVDVASDRGVPRLVAVVEPRDADGDLVRLAHKIDAASRETAGVEIGECVFVPKGRLPKTSSGKIRRFQCREIAAQRDSPYARIVVRQGVVA